MVQHRGITPPRAQMHRILDMDVVVVQAAFPHIFDQQVFRKGLILDIGVCIMEEK